MAGPSDVTWNDTVREPRVLRLSSLSTQQQMLGSLGWYSTKNGTLSSVMLFLYDITENYTYDVCFHTRHFRK